MSGALESNAVFGIVADGCSGARAATDIGARAIAWAFKEALEKTSKSSEKFLGQKFFCELQDLFEFKQYTGNFPDYLSTVVGFTATPSLAQVFVQGDGALALKYSDGRFCLIEFIWANNTPFYLNYHLSSSKMQSFAWACESLLTPPFIQRTTFFQETDTGLEVINKTEEYFKFDQVSNGHVLYFNPYVEGITALAVLTDGIDQVGSRSSLEVVRQLLAFKTHEGEFVKRRALKALKEFKSDNFIPRDDLGIAAVWF